MSIFSDEFFTALESIFINQSVAIEAFGVFFNVHVDLVLVVVFAGQAEVGTD